MGNLLFSQPTHGLWCTSRLRNLLKGPSYASEDDHPLATPTCAVRRAANRSQSEWRSPVYRNLLQFSSRNKSEPVAVGRKERVVPSFRAADGARLRTIQGPQINLLYAS